MDKSISSSHMNGEFAGGYSIARADYGSDGAQSDRSVQVINQYMALAAEAANIGFWCRDYDREEFWASDRWRALFGFTSSESLHIEKFFQCLHPNDRESTRQALEDAYHGDGTYQTEHSVLLPDGQLRWISCHGRLELGADNQPLRLLGVSVDITPRKVAELEARAHRNNAAHLLRVASLVELSASLAHELRQPLTAILGNVEAAQLLLAAETLQLAGSARDSWRRCRGRRARRRYDRPDAHAHEEGHIPAATAGSKPIDSRCIATDESRTDGPRSADRHGLARRVTADMRRPHTTSAGVAQSDSERRRFHGAIAQQKSHPHPAVAPNGGRVGSDLRD